MFKFKKKLTFYVICACFFVFILFLIPSFKAPFLTIAKLPIIVLEIARQELGAVIFFHKNFYENLRLKKEIDIFKSKENIYKEAAMENNRLKELLSLKQKTPLKVVSARVIARLPDNWSSGIIIDMGSRHGIKRGMVVINYLGLVGRVAEAADFYSKVMLVSDPNFSVSSLVQRSRQEGLVSGTLGASLIMRYLPEEADINVSDVVVTSGLNQNYPKALLIGTVLSVNKEFSGMSRYAVIRPAVNLSDIEEVLVVVSFVK